MTKMYDIYAGLEELDERQYDELSSVELNDLGIKTDTYARWNESFEEHNERVYY